MSRKKRKPSKRFVYDRTRKQCVQVPTRQEARRQGRTWPKVADFALGVEPEEVPAEREFDRQHGLVGVDYTADGDPVFSDQRAFKRYCEARGFFARNGGYGDPQRG